MTLRIKLLDDRAVEVTPGNWQTRIAVEEYVVKQDTRPILDKDGQPTGETKTTEYEEIKGSFGCTVETSTDDPAAIKAEFKTKHRARLLAALAAHLGKPVPKVGRSLTGVNLAT